MAAKTLAEIKDVELDPTGTFKYIQVKVTDKEDKAVTKIIVRGYERCPFHGDIFDETVDQIGKGVFKLKPLGGGRIKHDEAARSIDIYGYSQAYGPAKHEESAALIKAAYPGYTVTVSYDGY